MPTMDRLIALSGRLSTWITEAQTSGQLAAAGCRRGAGAHLFARACDPVVALLGTRASTPRPDHRLGHLEHF